MVSIVTPLLVMAKEHSGAILVNTVEKHKDAKHSIVPDAPEVNTVQLALAVKGKFVVRTAIAGAVTETTVVEPHLIFAVRVATFKLGTE